MKTTYNFELIQDYLDGILDSKKMSEIRHLIATDNNARTIAKGILIMRAHFETDRDIDDYLDDLLKKKQQLIKNKTERKNSFSFIKVAAAVILIAVSSIIVYQLNSAPNLEDLIAEEITNPYRISAILRDGVSFEVLNEGIVAYNQRNYTEAISKLNGVTSAQAIFLKGLSHLYTGEYQLAVDEFKNKILIKSRFEEQSRWYLAVSYLKMREMEKSRKVLEVIVSKTTHYKKIEAEKVLNFLEN